MYIIDHMTRNPVTVRGDLPLPAAREILATHNFRHLPVVDADGVLVGMLTDRDLRSAYPSVLLGREEQQRLLAALGETPVAAVMSRRFVTLPAAATLDDALFLLDREKVGAIPVVAANGRVEGIFSIRDLVKAYKILFGLGERGSAMVTVEDDGRGSPLTRIVKALEEHAIPFTRVVRMPMPVSAGQADRISLRVNTYNIHAVHAILEEAGFPVCMPEVSG